MKINLIGMPIYYGCDVKGTDLAYDALSKKNVTKKFVKHTIEDSGNIFVDEYAEKHADDIKIKYITPIINSNKLLYDSVIKRSEDTVSLIIGGDHASVIGNIAAELDLYDGDVTVIWVDAHTDIHTDKTTPSGNIHGMPLAILMGLCDDKFNIGKNKLNSENLIYIGTRSYEEEECELINEKNIRNYTYEYTLEMGLKNVVQEIINNIKTKYVHLSFDLDCFSYDEFKSVNVAYSKKYMTSGGFTIQEGKYILKEFLDNLNVCGIDVVEYNPLLDKYNDMIIVEDVLKIIDENLK